MTEGATITRRRAGPRRARGIICRSGSILSRTPISLGPSSITPNYLIWRSWSAGPDHTHCGPDGAGAARAVSRCRWAETPGFLLAFVVRSMQNRTILTGADDDCARRIRQPGRHPWVKVGLRSPSRWRRKVTRRGGGDLLVPKAQVPRVASSATARGATDSRKPAGV